MLLPLVWLMCLFVWQNCRASPHGLILGSWHCLNIYDTARYSSHGCDWCISFLSMSAVFNLSKRILSSLAMEFMSRTMQKLGAWVLPITTVYCLKLVIDLRANSLKRLKLFCFLATRGAVPIIISWSKLYTCCVSIKYLLFIGGRLKKHLEFLFRTFAK